MEVKKSDGTYQEFDANKLKKGIQESYTATDQKKNTEEIKEVVEKVTESLYDGITSQEIRRKVEERLLSKNFKAGKAYILNWPKREALNQFVIDKENFIAKYKEANNNADATVDDNSNTNGKNISLMNAEIQKPDNILISRAMVSRKLRELYPNFNSRNLKVI